MHRHLCDPVNFLRLRHTGDFQNGWCDVGTMSELAAQAAFLLDAFWPRNDHWVTNAAEMRGNLLPPFKRRVTRPCPRCCVVWVHVRAAPFVEATVSFDRF